MKKPNFTKKELENYYKKQLKYHEVIERDTNNDKVVVYGTKALNAQLPKFLQRPTEDWDIFSRTPKKDAKKLETALDKAYKGDYFYTEKALHSGTHKVKSHVTGKGVADYTRRIKGLPYITKYKTRFVPLSWIKSEAAKVLKDKDSKYRWNKDRDTLQRIKLVPKKT